VTFVRSFAYATGPAYGALLDSAAPGWRRVVSIRTDLGATLGGAYAVRGDAAAAAGRAASYDDGALRLAENDRAKRAAAKLAGYRALFVDGPVLRIPNRESSFSFDPNDVTPFPGVGTVYANFGFVGPFGKLQAPDGALFTSDYGAVVVPAPPDRDTTQTARWKLTLAAGCALVPDTRAGDFTIGCRKAPP
jgi:hypothetical protein